MEALYDGGTHEPLTVVGSLKIPEMLSYLATHDAAGYVPGINNILLGGYTLPDGSQALSVMEKWKEENWLSVPLPISVRQRKKK